MVGSIFNHLVTAFDIIPDSTSINICTNHPSTCVLTGKIRIISKRPFVYKSLTLTAKGTTCVLHRHGPRSMKGKQAFLHASKDIIYERPFQRSRRDSLSPLSSPIHDPVRISDHIEPTNVISNSPPRDSSISSDSSSLGEGSILHQSPPPFEPEEQSPASPSETVAAISQNQIEEGVNDIDFRIEFPSHHALNSQQHPNNQGNSSDLFSLPSGPVKTTGGRSTINYSLNASLIVSRKDILVNNQMSVSIPFQVQSWQDMIDRNRNDDSSYHGRRHDKIEFQFQVPKQLDLHRLGDLQFGFTAKWRALKDHIKVKEVQYYIIGEEQQK
ncbi:hypothetical protein BGZ49_009914 [Haplosporangium sp. Z 27]|nr:hypothetical protein BGZ49_009914 [Haplosporangium sp. Z 27]